MLEPAVILLRLIQYGGAMILFGSSLFVVYALPSRDAGSGAQLRWLRGLLGWSACALLLGASFGLLAQTSILAGSVTEGMRPSSLLAVITTMALGPSALIRIAAGLVALVAVLIFRPGRTLFWVCSALGAAACASFAWMGHGAATAGAGRELHLGSDILHALSAGVWVGALVVFVGLAYRRTEDPTLDGLLYRALHGFAGVGSALVAVLVGTGLVNSWFLVGPSRLPGMWTTPYGQLLSLKLVLFAGMLLLASLNRFRLTPALALALDKAEPSRRARAALRASVLLETTLAFAVLGLVAWLGMLAPVSSQ